MGYLINYHQGLGRRRVRRSPWGRVGAVFTAALGLLVLGALLMAPTSLQVPVSSTRAPETGTQKTASEGELFVSEAIMMRFAGSMPALVWSVAEPLDVMRSEIEVAASGWDDFWEEGYVVEWPLRRVRPIYETWDDGAELLWTRPLETRRLRYKIDPTFGFGNGLPRIQGMMIRFRLDF